VAVAFDEKSGLFGHWRILLGSVSFCGIDGARRPGFTAVSAVDRVAYDFAAAACSAAYVAAQR